MKLLKKPKQFHNKRDVIVRDNFLTQNNFKFSNLNFVVTSISNSIKAYASTTMIINMYIKFKFH